MYLQGHFPEINILKLKILPDVISKQTLKPLLHFLLQSYCLRKQRYCPNPLNTPLVTINSALNVTEVHLFINLVEFCGLARFVAGEKQ